MMAHDYETQLFIDREEEQIRELEEERDSLKRELERLKSGLMQYPRYSGEPWWCVVHSRPATHMFVSLGGEALHHCDPKLGGIMIPCTCVQTRPPMTPHESRGAETP